MLRLRLHRRMFITVEARRVTQISNRLNRLLPGEDAEQPGRAVLMSGLIASRSRCATVSPRIADRRPPVAIRRVYRFLDRARTHINGALIGPVCIFHVDVE